MATNEEKVSTEDTSYHIEGSKDVVQHKEYEEPIPFVGLEEDESSSLNFKQIMALVSLICTLNGYLFTLLMPPAMLAFINADLGPNPNYVWITVSWNLCAAVLVTVSGRLADIFGRRYFLITGTILSCIGALVGATAKNIPTMIVSGVLFGFGGGFQEMLYSCNQELVPNRYRMIILGINEMANLPAMFSPLIAYVFIGNTPLKWRTAYYWCFAFEFFALIMLSVFYHPPKFSTKHREDHKTKMQLLKELDYVGLITFSGACAILLMAITWGGAVHPWKSAAVITPIVLSGVLFIALGFWEAYMPLKYPLLPPRLFRKTREFTALLVTVFIAGMTYYSMLVIWPRLSAALWIPAGDLVIRGVYATMTSFSVILASVYCCFVMPWVGHERWQLAGLLCVSTAFLGASASLGVNDKGRAIAFVLLAGAPATAANILCFGMMSLGLDDQTEIGVAVGLVSTFRLIGGAIAGAIFTSVQGSRFRDVLPKRIAAAAASTGFTGSIPALLKAAATNTAVAYNKIPGMTPTVIAAAQFAVKEANVKSFSMVFYVAIAFGGIGIAAALSTKSVDLKKKGNQRAVVLENEKGSEVDLKSAV